MVNIKKSDWIKFKAIKEQALEKFCANAFAEFEATMHDESLSIHDRYLKLYDSVRKTDKRLARTFDGLSRSRAAWQMKMMQAKGLVDDEAMEELSDEFRERCAPFVWDDD